MTEQQELTFDIVASKEPISYFCTVEWLRFFNREEATIVNNHVGQMNALWLNRNPITIPDFQAIEEILTTDRRHVTHFTGPYLSFMDTILKSLRPDGIIFGRDALRTTRKTLEDLASHPANQNRQLSTAIEPIAPPPRPYTGKIIFIS